jgi:methylated-DNA-protein-cysteine methyltransferase-like protein
MKQHNRDPREPRSPGTSFEAEVIKVIKRLRHGQLASYGEIAEEAGFPRAARAVGMVLARNEGLPWWRVIRADGRLASPNEKEQGRLLKKEGVRIERGRVVAGSRSDMTAG